MYWPMEAVSTSGIIGGSERISPHRGQMSLVPGVRLNAAVFDGSTSGVLTDRRDTCFTNPELCPEGIVMSFWVKFLSIPSNVFYVLGNGGQTRYSFGYCVVVKYQKLMVMVKTKSVWWSFVSHTNVNINIWEEISITWSSDRGISVLNDGTKLGGSSSKSNQVISSTAYNEYRIGLPNNSEKKSFFGHFMIDELMFCAKWLSFVEDNDLFNSGIGKILLDDKNNFSFLSEKSTLNLFSCTLPVEGISQSARNTYSISTGERLSSVVPHLSSARHSSLVSCLLSCNTELLCLTAVYNRATSECRLYNVFTADLRSVAEAVYVNAGRELI